MAVPSLFPYGPDNAATSYSRSMHSTMSSYIGLPEYCLRATLELLATTSETSSTDSTEDNDRWASADFSGHICAPWEYLRPQKLPPEAGRDSLRVHLVLLQAMH
jgi:hypothetical protein